MRIVCLQHVPFEGPAALGTWAARQGFPLHVARLFARQPTPALDAFDLLLVLGGPMSVNDEARFDWLGPEKQFIRNAIQQGKRVLGICLGAQVIASALGARVFRNPEREIGWFPVRRKVGSSNAAFASLPETFVALHWHGETFDLPKGADWLAESEGCTHQAFGLGNHVLGLQFHLESTAESVEALVQNCPADLAPGRYVQDAKAMLAARDHFNTSNRLMASLLDAFTSTV